MVLMSSSSAPSMVVRLVLLAAFVVPLFKFKYLMPPVIICTMTLLSVTVNMLFLPLPYTDYYYYAIILFILLPQGGMKISFQSIVPFAVFWLYVISVDFIAGTQTPGMRQYFPMLLLLGLAYSGSQIEKGLIFILMNTYCFISILSSLLFLTNYQTFLFEYNSILGIERSGWNDPNYFSCIIGMGIVSAIIQLMRRDSTNRLVVIFWIATIIISIIAQVLLASRGGLLAVIVAFLVAVMSGKRKIQYKLLITILAVGFVVFLYNNGYFELLEYRIAEDDTGGGSGRIGIWTHKLNSFISSENPLNWIFGYGYDGGAKLGSKTAVGFHNDFIAMLVEYGLVGLGFLLWGLIRPYKQAAVGYKPFVLVLLVYMAVVCMTLEPLTQGNFPYMCFYLMIFVISKAEASYTIVKK